MVCIELLSRCSAVLNQCLREAAMGESSALWLVMADACDCVQDVGTAVKCIAHAEFSQSCGDQQCAELLNNYRSRLVELESALPGIGALLEDERGRLARETTFLGAARSWAETSHSVATAHEFSAR